MGPDSMSEYEREMASAAFTIAARLDTLQREVTNIKNVLADTPHGLNEIAVQLRAQNQLWTQFLLEGKE